MDTVGEPMVRAAVKVAPAEPELIRKPRGEEEEGAEEEEGGEKES